MTLDELQKQALTLTEAERRQLINALSQSLTNSQKRAPYGRNWRDFRRYCCPCSGRIRMHNFSKPLSLKGFWALITIRHHYLLETLRN